MKIIILILFCLPLFAHSESLKLCQESASEDPNLPVHEFNGRSFYGDHVAVVAQALSALKQSFSVDRLPWKRCIALVEKGDYDGAIGMGWTESRNSRYQFPAGDNDSAQAPFRISNINYSIYVPSDSHLTWDGHSFTQVRLGIAAPKGYLVEEQLRAMQLLQETDLGADSWITLLKHKRVDGVVLTEGVGDQLVAQAAPGGIKKLEIPFYRQPVFLVFSLRQQKLTSEQVDTVWQKIADIRESMSPAAELQGPPETQHPF